MQLGLEHGLGWDCRAESKPVNSKGSRQRCMQRTALSANNERGGTIDKGQGCCSENTVPSKGRALHIHTLRLHARMYGPGRAKTSSSINMYGEGSDSLSGRV